MGNNRRNRGLASEFYVAAELSRRGYGVFLAPGGEPSIDLIAVGVNHVKVQVKTCTRGNWVLGPADRTPRADVYTLLQYGDGEAPEYFIVPAPELAELLAGWERGSAVLNLGLAPVAHRKDRWDVVAQLAGLGVPGTVVPAG